MRSLAPTLTRHARHVGRIVVALTLACLAAAGIGGFRAPPAHAASQQTFIVLYKQSSVAADAIAKAGGTLVYSYDAIGVAIARSDNPAFADAISQDGRVEGAAATATYATHLRDDSATTGDTGGPPPGDLPNAPASDTDSLSPLQWDMRQIHTPEAHAITGGSPAVLVGDIDTGLDYRHPDLRQNVDDADSVNCVSGAPVPGMVAANDDNGHGTHTAGTIAAAANGFGIVGVAPNVHIAGIKAGNAAGFFFPEAVVCAFMWAGSHHFDVTNNSYFADPFLFNCRNDPVQRAIWKAEKRAIQFAMQQGVTVVAAAGNESDDLAHPTQDVTSPDNGTPVPRPISNDCVVIPVEIPGVVGVTADGNLRIKSFYSSYGVSAVQVVAPGGDSILQRTAEAPNGRVLSTWPANQPCTRSVKEPTSDPTYPTAVYCYLQGTSMASPHVAGVAALIISRFGDLNNPQNGKMRPDRVQAYIDQTADPMDCPAPDVLALYAPFPSVSDGAPQTCQGGTGYNSWYGHGQVNALNAVTHTAG